MVNHIIRCRFIRDVFRRVADFSKRRQNAIYSQIRIQYPTTKGERVRENFPTKLIESRTNKNYLKASI